VDQANSLRQLAAAGRMRSPLKVYAVTSGKGEVGIYHQHPLARARASGCW